MLKDIFVVALIFIVSFLNMPQGVHYAVGVFFIGLVNENLNDIGLLIKV